MNRLFMSLVIAQLFCGVAQAQKPYVPSGELIQKGSALHDEQKYKEAIELYRQVSRNDTNYLRSLYEIAFSQYADSNYQEALKTCDLGLSMEDKEQEVNFLTVKANTLDDMGKTDEALATYDSAIAHYPNSDMLLLNKAVTLQRMEKFPEAISILQKILVRSPYFSSAHFRLAQCVMQQGKLVQALMSLYAYLLIKPEGNYSGSAIQIISAISKGTDEMVQYASSKTEEDAFERIQKIILSKIALDKNYKLAVRLDDPIFRQLQVMLEKLEYQSDDPDFWMQFYVPTFQSLFRQNQTEASLFHAFSAVKLEAIQDYTKRNSKGIKEMIQLLVQDWNKLRETREINHAKRKSMESVYHFDDGVLFANGRMVNDKPSGNWTFFYDNGQIKSKGLFDADGKKDGRWTFYYQNHGGISGYEEWKHGVQWGEEVVYNKQGIPATRLNYVNGKLEGEKRTYYGIGPLFSTEIFKDGKSAGKYETFYASGAKKVEANSANDELNGAYTSYHANGQVEVKCNYANGKLQGEYQEFGENGKLIFKAAYQNGEPLGEMLSYHSNGQLKRKASYPKGTLEGDELEYDTEGRLISKIPYKNGKAEGWAEYYDEDKLYSAILFDKNRLKQVRYLDKTGKEISNVTRQGKEWMLTTYTAMGRKASEVKFDDKDQKQGEMTYFFGNGDKKETFQYKNGELEGTGITWFPNGKKQYVSDYSADQRTGSYQAYYINGQQATEGRYTEGRLNGDWIEYNEKGKVDSRTSYLNDDITGIRHINFANGQLDYEEVYRNGWLESMVQYDTTGKVIARSSFPNGNGAYKGVYFNGKPRFEGSFVNGSLHGPYLLYYINGNIQHKKAFEHGRLHGPFISYHFNGKKASEGEYQWGKKTGLWKNYSEDGFLFQEETYVEGELHGEQKIFHRNGQPERVVVFKNGDKQGPLTRYSLDGQVMGVFYFHHNEVYGYSYPGKDKQLVPMIPLPGGTGKVVTYFSHGGKSAEMEYINGFLHGAYRMYFPDGKLYYSSEEYYNNSNGKIIEYYPNGKTYTETSYYFDNQDGPFRRYNENGTLKEEGFAFNGYNHGWNSLYDANGKLLEKRLYYYGLVINTVK